ncbi:MAG TPA: hypothetical protein PKC76_04000 [Saprospiraceae bacterium]|nr:hypothetical protein [Saprospiraceae bacterium]HMP23265.1 hypothetical protein [Saprospiraceae bacterium]
MSTISPVFFMLLYVIIAFIGNQALERAKKKLEPQVREALLPIQRQADKPVYIISFLIVTSVSIYIFYAPPKINLTLWLSLILAASILMLFINRWRLLRHLQQLQFPDFYLRALRNAYLLQLSPLLIAIIVLFALYGLSV